MKVNWRAVGRFFLILALFFWCAKWTFDTREALRTTEEQIPSIILDAGHGGEDGGAVSPNGVSESGINLEITLRLEQLLALLGEPVLLLRREDVSLHDSDAVTLREKKVSDLKHRKAVADGLPTATLVSIHQNSYSDPKYAGAQVFYSSTEGSQALAQDIQRMLRILQPDNSRQEKPIPEHVYLLNHIENRAVLVECGFLTNPKEESELRREEYQRKLSVVLASALVQGS